MFVLHSKLAPKVLSILIPEHELQLFRMSLEIVIDLSTVETMGIPLDMIVHQFILCIELVQAFSKSEDIHSLKNVRFTDVFCWVLFDDLQFIISEVRDDQVIGIEDTLVVIALVFWRVLSHEHLGV